MCSEMIHEIEIEKRPTKIYPNDFNQMPISTPHSPQSKNYRIQVFPTTNQPINLKCLNGNSPGSNSLTNINQNPDYIRQITRSTVHSGRKDRMGNSIEKMVKRHHVSFKDEIMGENLADVKEVDSYKKYNHDSDEEETKRCRCLLL